MKRRFMVGLLAGSAILAQAAWSGTANGEGEYPLKAQFEACLEQSQGAQCEYYEQLKKYVVYVSGECISPQTRVQANNAQSLYCEPYPEIVSK